MWEVGSPSIKSRTKGQGKEELLSCHGHANTDRELRRVQVVNAQVTTLSHVSKFRNHAVHQVQLPKAVRGPLHFLEDCDIFFQLPPSLRFFF